jgi:hypothetical protein
MPTKDDKTAQSPSPGGARQTPSTRPPAPRPAARTTPLDRAFLGAKRSKAADVTPPDCPAALGSVPSQPAATSDRRSAQPTPPPIPAAVAETPKPPVDLAPSIGPITRAAGSGPPRIARSTVPTTGQSTIPAPYARGRVITLLVTILVALIVVATAALAVKRVTPEPTARSPASAAPETATSSAPVSGTKQPDASAQPTLHATLRGVAPDPPPSAASPGSHSAATSSATQRDRSASMPASSGPAAIPSAPPLHDPDYPRTF